MEYTGILPLNLQFFADGGEEPGVRQPVNTPSPPANPAAIHSEIQRQIDEAKEKPEEQRFLWPCFMIYLLQGASTHSKRNCSGTQYSSSSFGPQLLEPMPF